uniref:hypothetical protein n=1 Tax=Aliarcobacter sp. TaxID=2321116 RepID=UPI004047A957
MNISSLNRTLNSVDYIEPIYLKDFKRSWNAFENKTSSYSTTYLGIEQSKNSSLNAVIFQIEDKLIQYLDQREFLYDRCLVNKDKIKCIENSRFNFSNDDKIWIYLTKAPKTPTNNNPIIQSYVDICLTGAIDLETKFKLSNFAKDFILSTDNWSNFWVNDRIFPRAPHINIPYAYKIDSLLNELIPDYFKSIEIE